MTTAANRGRRKAQRGDVLVEATMVTLLLFGLLFLVIDLSLAFYTKATLQSAAEAGVRFGTTEQLGSGLTYLNDSIVQVVQQNALGMLNGANGACKISVRYFNPYTGLASTGMGGDVLEVTVAGYNYTPVGILKSAAAVSITASSSDVLEPCPLAGCPPTANPHPPTCP